MVAMGSVYYFDDYIYNIRNTEDNILEENEKKR
jgi:hypothetical protein